MSTTKLKTGRPRLEKEDSKAARQARAEKQKAWIAMRRETHVRVSTWLPRADAAALKTQARQDGVDASEVVRRALSTVLPRSSKAQAKAAQPASAETALPADAFDLDL